MYNKLSTSYLKLIKQEQGWEVVTNTEGASPKPSVIAYGKEFPLLHPYQIFLRLYRDEVDPEMKYYFMKRVHDFLWPQYLVTWNEWTERRFKAHCGAYRQVVLAGGASVGKSLDVAKIALIFWLSDPAHNTCIIASTTLESLESRIWGYVMKLSTSMALPVPLKILRSKPPKVTYPGQMDRIHGMFAVAIRQGEDETVLSTIIGRHPDKGLLIVLDEATDMNPALTKAFPNLEQGTEFFQIWAIGNSASKNDLHGALATPRKGWDAIDPMRDDLWETVHKQGICLYFNPYKSPAILERDIEKKIELSKFLITAEGIKEKEATYGKTSSSFARFVLGFWSGEHFGDTSFSDSFLTEHQVGNFAEWSGFYPLEVVAGLDPEFQIGGTGCLLRLAVWGQTTSGMMCLDYRKDELLFRIQIRVDVNKSSERQIAEQVCVILRKYNCPISNLAIDATGVGRALGELITLVSGNQGNPYRIVSVRPSLKKGVTDPYILVIDPGDMWLAFRNLIQHNQIRGVDSITLQQLVNRRIEFKGSKMILESKRAYRDRMSAINPKLAHSPDESDAMMLATQAAILRYGFAPGMRKELINSGVSDFWTQKMYVVERERQEQQELVALGPSRPLLLPNFQDES